MTQMITKEVSELREKYSALNEKMTFAISQNDEIKKLLQGLYEKMDNYSTKDHVATEITQTAIQLRYEIASTNARIDTTIKVITAIAGLITFALGVLKAFKII